MTVAGVKMAKIRALTPDCTVFACDDCVLVNIPEKIEVREAVLRKRNAVGLQRFLHECAVFEGELLFMHESISFCGSAAL